MTSASLDVLLSRKQEAVESMPACLLHMVQNKEELKCSTSGTSFEITDVMDGGGFATLLKGTLIFSPNTKKTAAAKIAVDMETDQDGVLTDQQRQSYQASMRHEHKVYESLLNSKGSSAGIPPVYFAGGMKKAGNAEHPKKLYFMSFMVMELLGPSVGYLSLELQSYKNNMQLLVNHGLGMLKALRSMHESGLVHRDVKPDNFCLPRGFDPNKPSTVETVYVVDMGMAEKIDHKGFDWDKTDCLYMGTVDYSSVRALRGHHQTGKDDLEGLAVTLLEMATGQVPFDLVQGDDGPLTAERLQRIAAQKEKDWQAILAKPETPAFIKQWIRHLNSMPAKHLPAPSDYRTLQVILTSALAPRCNPTSSAWSSAERAQAASAVPEAVSTKKRAAPAASAASNLMSSMSEAATAVQSKRPRWISEEEDDEGASMVCGLVAVSQSQEE